MLKRDIEEDGGGLLYTSIDNVSKLGTKLSCIIVKQSNFNFYNSFIETMEAQGVKIVNENWLKASLKQKYFISTSKFIKGLKLSEYSKVKYKSITEGQNIDLLLNDPLENMFFTDFTFYIAVDEQYKLSIMKLVSLAGGIIFPIYLPTVNYVIAFELSVENRDNYVNSIIVTPEWLCDCITYKRVLPMDEYPVEIKTRYYPVSFSEAFKGNNSINGNFKILFSNDTKDSKERKESKLEDYFGKPKVYSSSPMKKLPKKPKEKLIQLKIQSYLFQNMWFYIAHPKLQDYSYLIKEHSGRILRDISTYDPKRKLIFIHFDGQEAIETIKEYSSYENISHFSYRWINSCTKKKKLIKDPQLNRLIDLLPFPHSTPYSDFMGKVCYVTGFQISENETLKEILRTLGAKISFDLFYFS